MRSALAILISHTEAIMCLPKIVTLHGCEERMGNQRGTKVAPWWKATSWDETTLISEEIKSLTLAILELCLSEGIK